MVDQWWFCPVGIPFYFISLFHYHVDPVKKHAQANDIMSHPFTFNVGGGNKAKIGLAADLTAVTNVKAWKMTLSSDQESLV